MKLYKYRPINDHTKDIFRNRKIYCPKLSEFNDPFDCKFKIENDVTREIYYKHVDVISKMKNANRKVNRLMRNSYNSISKRNEVISHAKKTLKNSFKNYLILSLSEIQDNILMWSHYTKDHKGVCIELDIPDAEHLVKINYSLSYPVINLSTILIADDKEMNKAFEKITETKAEYRKYEQERRFYFENESQGQIIDFRDFKGEIAAVYFGCNCEDKNIQDIIKLCREFKICDKFYKYKKSDSAYKLEIDEKYF